MIYSFEKLDVWQKSREIVMDIYRLTASFPQEERFGLTSQFRRASKLITFRAKIDQMGRILNSLYHSTKISGERSKPINL